MATVKLKHFVVWYEKDTGVVVKYRTTHSAMEKLVNEIINSSSYIPESLKVIVGTEVLTPETGAEWI